MVKKGYIVVWVLLICLSILPAALAEDAKDITQGVDFGMPRSKAVKALIKNGSLDKEEYADDAEYFYDDEESEIEITRNIGEDEWYCTYQFTEKGLQQVSCLIFDEGKEPRAAYARCKEILTAAYPPQGEPLEDAEGTAYFAQGKKIGWDLRFDDIVFIGFGDLIPPVRVTFFVPETYKPQSLATTINPDKMFKALTPGMSIQKAYAQAKGSVGFGKCEEEKDYDEWKEPGEKFELEYESVLTFLGVKVEGLGKVDVELAFFGEEGLYEITISKDMTSALQGWNLYEGVKNALIEGTAARGHTQYDVNEEEGSGNAGCYFEEGRIILDYEDSSDYGTLTLTIYMEAIGEE